jgi:hypothetical membrane protein
MSVLVEASTPTPGAKYTPVQRLFLWAGFIAPILFAAVFMIDGFLKPGYSTYNEAISYLELGDYGWIQRVNFLLIGLLLGVFLVGYIQRMRPILGQGWLYIGCTLLALSDLGWIMAGLFVPNTFLAPQFGWPAVLHQVAFNTVFLPLTLAWIVLGVKFVLTRRWRVYGCYCLIIGIPLTAFSIVNVIHLVDPALVAGIVGDTIKPGDGVVNRIILFIAPLPWYVITATLVMVRTGSRMVEAL